MDAIERLEAIEAIKRLKARYFRCLDTKDWDGFAAVFAPDLVADVSADSGRVVEGADEFVASVRKAVGDVETVHHGHMPEIEITSDTTASGIWAMEDLLRFPDGAPVATLHGFGHYEETYRLVDGEWKIATLRLTRLRRDLT